MKNTFVKVLSFVMALTMIMSSFVFVATAADAEHTHEYSETVVPATCISKGHTVYTCECGDYYIGNPTNKLTECRAEDLKDVAASAPTCTEPAYVAHKECGLCGKVYGKEAVKGSKPNGHDFELSITDPDCGIEGSMKQVCKVCGYEETQFVCPPDEPCSLAGHLVSDYVYVIKVAPTCTTTGLADYVCPVEGCTGGYRDILVTARGHAYGAAVVVDPDCLNAGSSTKTCAKCGDKQVTPIPALGHNHVAVTDPTHDCVIDNEEVDVLFQDSTCYQEGYQWKHCTRCDDLIKAPVARKDHTWIKDTADKDNDLNRTEILYTYEVAGEHYTETSLARMIAYLEANVAGFQKCTTTINGYRKCADCAYLERVDAESRLAPGHTWESKVWTGANAESPFCSTKGWEIVWDEDNATDKKPCVEGAKNYYIRECTECTHDDKTYYFTVEHNYGYVCTDANCTTTKEITLYDGSVVTVQDCQDCTHTGRQYVCYVCGDARNAKHDDHVWVKTDEIAVDATCNLPAKYVYVCSNEACAQTRNEYVPSQIRLWVESNGEAGYQWGEEADYGYAEFLDPTNHQPYDPATETGVQHVDPTCINDGFEKGFCNWCGTNVDIPLPKSDEYHNYSITLEAGKTPTCMEVGKVAKVECEHCGDVKGGNTLPKDPENHADAGCTLSATPVYTRYATCTVTYAEMYQWSLCKAFKPVNEGQKNPANHVIYSWTDAFVIDQIYSTVKTVAAVDPTCTTTGMHLYTYCEECGYIVDVDAKADLNNIDTDTCKYDNDRRWTNTVTGTETYICPENHGYACEGRHCTLATHKLLASYQEVVPAGILAELDAVTGNYNDGYSITKAMVDKYYADNNKKADVEDDFVIAALGHDFWFDADVTKATDTDDNNILLVLLHETCTAPGNEWKIQCNRCTAIDSDNNGETILPHGVNADNFHRFENILYPTCTEDGHKQGLFCDECSYTTDPHGQACAVCNGSDYVLEATGHNLVSHFISTPDCVTEGFEIFKCCNINLNNGEECFVVDAEAWISYGEDYTPALGSTNHNYTTITTPADCANEGFDTHVCANCGDTYTNNVKPALGHKDENGNTLLFSCTDYLYNRGVECAVCNEKVTVDANGDVVDGINNEYIDHNYEIVVINPGCEVAGETYEQCADCGHIKQAKNAAGVWEDIRTPIDATGHDVGEIVDDECLAATPEHDGYCTWICANCGEKFVYDIPYTRDVEFDLTVVPYLNGKDSATLTFLNGGYIQVLLTVKTEALVFTSFKYQLGYNNDLLTYVGSEFVFDFGANTYVQDNGNNVTLGGYFLGDKTGTFDGLDVAVLKVTFKVAPGVAVIDDSVVYSAVAEFDNAATETINYPVFNGFDAIEVALNGDINEDGRYTMEDVKLIKDIIGAGEYSDVADIDKNGAVELTDFALLAKFVTSNQTIADYYAMFGIDVVALANAYDHNDYNDDGNITNVDSKLFRDFVVDICEDNWVDVVEYELGDFTAVLDEIDDYLLS